MRMSGMVSGLETDTIVRDMMKVERTRVDRYSQKKQVGLWKQEEYHSTNKNIANFILNSQQNMGLKRKGSTGIMLNQSYKNLEYMRMASSSNKDVADIKVRGSASNGTFDINVKQIAESSYNTIEGLDDLNEKHTGKIEIAGVVIFDSDTVKEGESKEISTKEIMRKINTNKELKEKGVTAFHDSKSRAMFIQGDAGLDLKIKKNGEEIKTATIDLGNEGKLKSDMVIGGIKFKANTTTADVKKELVEKNIEFTEDGDKLTFKLTSKSGMGKNSIVEINGVTIEGGNNKVQFNGLDIDIKAEGISKITVETDHDEIIDKIKGLVKEYNDLLDDVSKSLNQKKYPGYHPLSSDEKSAMKDNDVKLWEEKSRSGMLNNDETLKKMLSNTREDLYKNVQGLEGSFSNITEIGITTQKYAKGTTGGKLQIDEDKLRRALEQDTDGVMELMFGKGKLEEGKELEKNQTTNGIFTGIYENLTNGMKEVINKSGPGEDSELLRNVRSNILIDFVSHKGSISDIDKDVKSLERKITDLEKMLSKKEESYYKQFTNMEKQMQKMFSQSNWIAQQSM